MLRKTEIDVRILDAVIKSLNHYLLSNKNKVIRNESKRSEDIETIAEYIYDCFDEKMNDVIDTILSNKNISSPNPDIFPSLESLPRFTENKTDSINRYYAALSKIKSHQFKTGWWGQSELKSGIENCIREQVLSQSIKYLDIDSLNNMKSVSKFFHQSIPRESWILFYSDNASENEIDFLTTELFKRIPVCFRSKNLLDGNISLQVKKDNFNISTGQTLNDATKKVIPGALCFAIKLNLLLSDIDQMQKDSQFKEILASILELHVLQHHPNHITQITRLDISYNLENAKFSMKEVRNEGDFKHSSSL